MGLPKGKSAKAKGLESRVSVAFQFHPCGQVEPIPVPAHPVPVDVARGPSGNPWRQIKRTASPPGEVPFFWTCTHGCVWGNPFGVVLKANQE